MLQDYFFCSIIKVELKVKEDNISRLESGRMSMYIRPSNDYSVLFSSLSTKQNINTSMFGSSGNMSDLTSSVLGNSQNSGGINLGDYTSIKNGSYRKLMKSYFAMKAEQENTDETVKKDEKTEETGKVLASTWEDIVASANAKTDALYTELGLKEGTVSAGSYLDTIV